jgi:hypothetical protein
VSGPYFNENIPLRNQPPVINTVAGAMEIQQLLDNTDWVIQSANPVAYAPHLRKDPLAGVPAKSVIFQFAKGDQSVPNPTTTALLRAGDLADRATFYRNDLAFADDPAVPTNPHVFMTSITNPAMAAIARGAQEQIATFFESDGEVIIHPQPSRFFEVPIAGPLPEVLNFIPPNPPGGAAAPMPGSNAFALTAADPAGGSPPMPGLFSPVQLGGQQWVPEATPSAPPTQQLPSGPQVGPVDGLFASPHPEKPKRIAPRSKAALPGELASMIEEVVL